MWVDPITAFGDFSVPLLISNLATLLGFVLAAFFALKYTNNFYEGRATPKSWFFIILGLSIVVISETLQVLLLYTVEPLSLLRSYNAIALVIQDIAMIMIVLGCLFLFREVS